MTRAKIATHLLQGCPEESLEDHEAIATAIRSGASLDVIMNMPETDRWPETYSWLRLELEKISFWGEIEEAVR